MVCGFCPGAGTSAEKCFNRADVFKRHLTSVHGVEQTPPNGRNKTTIARNNKRLSVYASDATCKCSTCPGEFDNAQVFYEHLDDCVLQKVQQTESAEGADSGRLPAAEKEQNVHETLFKNELPKIATYLVTNEDADEDGEDNDECQTPSQANDSTSLPNTRGLTHSKGGVTLAAKGRKKRKDYPPSWGVPASDLKLEKQAPCGFGALPITGKADTTLGTDLDSHLKVDKGKVYITDLELPDLDQADLLNKLAAEGGSPLIVGSFYKLM